MDIIIRNGVIQNTDIKENYDFLKKNFDNYSQYIDGPYYDLKNCHLCIPRKHYDIKNFNGPQDPYLTKLIENNNNYNKKASYCCICHKEMKSNESFIGKRKIFVDDDYYEKKEDKLNIEMTKTNNYIEDNNNELSNIINSKIIDKQNIEYIENLNVKKYYRVINNYYKIVYKLLYKPILYNLSTKETKLIWPWELTTYQKFKLNNPDYKTKLSFYKHQREKIRENYIMIL